MRLALLAIAVAVGAALIGFDPPYIRTLTTSFPVEADSFSSGLEVRIHDVSGLVQGAQAGHGSYGGGPPWIAAEGVAGQPNDLRVTWMGGACLARIRVAVVGTGERLGIHISEERSPGGMLGCMAVGVGRGLVLHLSKPVDPGKVVLRYAFG